MNEEGIDETPSALVKELTPEKSNPTSNESDAVGLLGKMFEQSSKKRFQPGACKSHFEKSETNFDDAEGSCVGSEGESDHSDSNATVEEAKTTAARPKRSCAMVGVDAFFALRLQVRTTKLQSFRISDSKIRRRKNAQKRET